MREVHISNLGKALYLASLAQVGLLLLTLIVYHDRRELEDSLRVVEYFITAKALLTAEASKAEFTSTNEDGFISDATDSFYVDWQRHHESSETKLEIEGLLEFSREHPYRFTRKVPISGLGWLTFHVNPTLDRAEQRYVTEELSTTTDYDCPKVVNPLGSEFLNITIGQSSNLIWPGRSMLITDLALVYRPDQIFYGCFERGSIVAHLESGGSYASSTLQEIESKIFEASKSYGLMSDTPEKAYQGMRFDFETQRVKVPILGLDVSYGIALLAISLTALGNAVSIEMTLRSFPLRSNAEKEKSEVDTAVAYREIPKWIIDDVVIWAEGGLILLFWSVVVVASPAIAILGATDLLLSSKTYWLACLFLPICALSCLVALVTARRFIFLLRANVR